MRIPRALSGLAHDLAVLNIQGASAIAHETLHGLAHYVSGHEPRSATEWRAIFQVSEALTNVRPTEPLARNLVQWFLHELKLRQNMVEHTQWEAAVARVGEEITYEERQAEAALVHYGSRLVHTKDTIFTHCHSSLAEHILTTARAAGKQFTVYHTETRPLFQGRTTDIHLRRAQVKTILVADSAAAFLISDHSGDDVKIDWVLLGADSLARDGSALNKIGSFGIALAAQDSKIPLYVAAPLFKIDWHNQIKIELRQGNELWSHAPRQAHIINYAFDRVPARFISGIITEVGILRPTQLAQAAIKKYPWLRVRSV